MRIRRQTCLWVCLAICLPVAILQRRPLEVSMGQAQSWPQALEAAQSCGAHQRCELYLEATDASSSRSVSGPVRLLAADKSGVLADLNGNQVWLGPEPHSGVRHLIPQSCEVRLGNRLASRAIALHVEGRTVDYVAGRVWKAVVDCPDPQTYRATYDWSAQDVRLNGRIGLDGTWKHAKLPAGRGMRWEGRYLVLEQVTARDFMELNLKARIRDAQLSVDLPQIIPDPRLTPESWIENEWS